jgi:comEA protein
MVMVPGRTSGLGRWLERWPLILFFCLIGLMGWMIASLVWPQPKTQITLSPLKAYQWVVSGASAMDEGLPAESEIVANQEGLEASEDSSRSAHPKKPRKRHHSTKKKPAHPPVLNLNSASLSQLQLLPGIGPKMAQRIVDYRKAQGSFSSPEQVMDVKGIGPKKFEKLKAFLKV